MKRKHDTGFISWREMERQIAYAQRRAYRNGYETATFELELWVRSNIPMHERDQNDLAEKIQEIRGIAKDHVKNLYPVD